MCCARIHAEPAAGQARRPAHVIGLVQDVMASARPRGPRATFSSPSLAWTVGGRADRSLPVSSAAGRGRVPGTESLNVELPAGVNTGSRIRVPGKGDAGRFGGPAGDLYVVVNAAAHPFFKRIGDNIHCAIPLTITEAALGTKIEVPDGRWPCFCAYPARHAKRTDVPNARKGCPFAAESRNARRSVRGSKSHCAQNWPMNGPKKFYGSFQN